MEPNTNDTDLNKELNERFAELPKVVQDAITSADVQKHLRDLADTHKLHLDQWQVLENNVMLTLLGFQPIQGLASHLQKDLSVTPEVASELAGAISTIVFEPIRGEMEKNLDHPSVAEEANALEDMRTSALETAQHEERAAAVPNATAPASQPIVPATPPPAPPTERAVRGSVAGNYVGAASHERKSIEGDPYREQLG